MKLSDKIIVSISAVVFSILIIIIVILIRKINAIQYSEPINPLEIKPQMIEKMDTTGKSLIIANPKLKVASSERIKLYYGIKNNIVSPVKCFYIEFVCVCTRSDKTCQNPVNGSYRWDTFLTSYEQISLIRGEHTVLYAELLATGPRETYNGKLYVWSYDTNATKCPPIKATDYNVDPATGRAGSGELASQLKFYAAEDFTVEVR